MDTFILVLQLFTGLPIHKQVAVTDERLVKGVVFWPVAGMVIGFFDALVFWLADRFLPLQIAVMLAIASELWMTRGFHLDGICDTADAVFSSRSRERMLEIMKDSHIGTFGVAAMIGDLAMRYMVVSLSGVPLALLLIGPVAGKMVQGICMYKAAYPRSQGLGKSYIGKISMKIMGFTTVIGAAWIIICQLYFFGGVLKAVILPVACCVFAYILKRRLIAIIGGMTGDTLGAASELTEIFSMLLCLIMEGIG